MISFSCIFISRFRVSTRWCHIICRCSHIGVNCNRVYAPIFIIARKATPFLNKVLDISSNEIFIIVIFAILFFVAGFSETIHVAEAIGALLLGLVFSETEHSDRIEKLVVPFRDFFGAIFFSASV